MTIPNLRTLDDYDLEAKRVLVRVDINVPIQRGTISDDTRIRRIMPTVRDIVAHGGHPVLMSHLGRPEGRPVSSLSLGQLIPRLEEVCDLKARLVSDLEGPTDAGIKVGEDSNCLIVLENLRFHDGEKGNDPAFAKTLSKWGDIYCNDAFATAHRSHASVVGVSSFLPSCAGRSMMQELSELSTLASPQEPVAAIVGGAKVSTKIGLLRSLASQFEYLVIGGAMANTFLIAQGYGVGKSLAEPGKVDVAAEILKHARRSGCEVVLPSDITLVVESTDGPTPIEVNVDECPAHGTIYDVGSRTVQKIASVLEECRTVVWNGPLGLFEVPPFDRATVMVARRIAKLTRQERLSSVIGGGDTVAAVTHAGVRNEMGYVSTAGGAFIAYLEGKELPGIAAISCKTADTV